MNKERKSASFMSFWSINDELDLDKLKKQMNELKEAGIGGVVFHPRYYPNVPGYLSDVYMDIVSKLILHAKEIGMEFWMYDENGWPSGTADGKVMEQNPEFRSQAIGIAKDGEMEEPEEGWIYSFRIDNNILNGESGAGGLYHTYRQSWAAPSSIETKACNSFIQITHEAFKKKLEPEAFEYITGFFCDEVHFPMKQPGCIPWADSLNKRYMERYGEELIPQLPSIFFRVGDYRKVRIRFWELATDALAEGFYKPLLKWGEENNKLMTGHLKGEETPVFQIPFSGSCFQNLKHMSMPGIDTLERDPGNNFFPSIASSTANQFGSGDCLAEAMGGCGWGVEPDDLIKYFTWLMKHGINKFVIHINQLKLNSRAVRDWPPSMPCHITWKGVFPAVIHQIHEMGKDIYKAQKQPDVLIIVPTRGAMAEYEPWEATVTNQHNGTNAPDTPATGISGDFIELVEELNEMGVHYEFTEERIMEEEGTAEDGSLVIGNRGYRRIIIPESCYFTEKGNEVIRRLKAAGADIWHGREWKGHLKCSKQKDCQHEIESGSIPPQTEWEATMPEYNLFALEAHKDEGGTVYSSFVQKGVEEIDIVLLEPARAVLINGKKLEGTCIEDRYVYNIPTNVLKNNDGKAIKITYMNIEDENPFIFLKGNFLVKSLSTYEKTKKNEVATKGPFILVQEEKLQTDDLITSGLQFCPMPVKMEKQVDFTDCRMGAIKLSGVRAAAANIAIGGRSLGWCWAPDWSIRLPAGFDGGLHTVSVELIPDTFNVYGPHHHIYGDIHLVSSDQYKGIRNCVDPMYAPETTTVDRWNFKCFGIGEDVVLT